MQKYRFALIGLLTVFMSATAFSVSASAQSSAPRLIGNYSKWSAYTYNEDGGKVCYMAAQPDKAEGAYTSRGDIFALVTNRPSDGTRNVFSYVAGYEYGQGAEATLIIGAKRFTLFTQGETAWAADAATDNAIAQAIRQGASLVVKGTSARGTATTDTFSLRGSGAAHDAMTEECKK